MHLLVAVAQSSPAMPSVDLTQVLQFGLLGLIFLCLVFRKYIVPEWTLKDSERRSAAREAELERRLGETQDQLQNLLTVFQDQMIPSLTRATEVNAKYTDELQRARYLRDRDQKRTEE